MKADVRITWKYCLISHFLFTFYLVTKQYFKNRIRKVIFLDRIFFSPLLHPSVFESGGGELPLRST